MVEFYKYGDLGYAVDPESDMKEITVILIGKQMTKCNPRPCVIYVTGGKIDESYAKLEELKAYCEENKVVYLCPTATDVEGLNESYRYAVDKCKDLNIRPDAISVKATAEYMSVGQELVEYTIDEYDAEMEDAEECDL